MPDKDKISERISDLLEGLQMETFNLVEADMGMTSLPPERINVKRKAEAKITQLLLEERLAEINGWFDMPKHYPGEEYRDEPFAKVKCKTPGKVSYYTLDSNFTYALITRIKELEAALKEQEGTKQ